MNHGMTTRWCPFLSHIWSVTGPRHWALVLAVLCFTAIASVAHCAEYVSGGAPGRTSQVMESLFK